MDNSGCVTVIDADITKLQVEAVVNAANRSLLGGGGVHGAIHRAAGPALLEERRAHRGCPTGEARITRGYNLPASWIIHAVGPVWRGGRTGESELLAKCYRNTLELAEKHGLASIAFPAISAGAYGFPLELALKIALSEMLHFAECCEKVREIILVCFGRETFAVAKTLLEELRGGIVQPNKDK